MSNNIEIKNCFQFVCPENWNNFEKTDDENVRFCGSCEKQVFKATDEETPIDLLMSICNLILGFRSYELKIGLPEV